MGEGGRGAQQTFVLGGFAPDVQSLTFYIHYCSVKPRFTDTHLIYTDTSLFILGDPGADSGDEEKSKRAEKYMARRKVKNGEKSPWGQFWHQSEARTAATVWNWSGILKTLSPGALLAVLYFSSCHIFFRPFRLFLVPTICPWVSEDAHY